MKKFRLTLVIEGEDESCSIPCCDFEAVSMDEAYERIKNDLEEASQNEE